MNICLCGAQASYLHEPDCPYPLYRATHEQAQVWNQARRARRQVLKRQERADANRKQIDKRRE